jgi:bifunctional DNA-binding transcriptional regulator/antitoxin component of YhaV-PrlF toxin-antitoxin module
MWLVFSCGYCVWRGCFLGFALLLSEPIAPYLGVSVCVLGAVGCFGCEMRLFSVLLCPKKRFKVRLCPLHVELMSLPDTEEISFKARLEKRNRIQVPKPLRLRYGLDSGKVLNVSVFVLGAHWHWEDFHTNMDKSGRITVPKLTLELLEEAASISVESFVGFVLEVNLEIA